MKVISLIFLSLLCVSTTWAQEKDYKFKFGIGAALSDRRDDIGKVKDEDTASARMVADRKLVPAFSLMNVPKPIFNKDGLKWLRWSVELGASPFKVNKQVENRITDVVGTDSHNIGNEVDLGTEIKGVVFYLNPTINFYHEISEKIYIYLGFGAGVGYSSLKGDYLVTGGANATPTCLASTTFAAVVQNCERRTVNVNKFGLSQNAEIGASIGFLGMRYSRGGPSFSDGREKHQTSSDSGALYLQFFF